MKRRVFQFKSPYSFPSPGLGPWEGNSPGRGPVLGVVKGLRNPGEDDAGLDGVNGAGRGGVSPEAGDDDGLVGIGRGAAGAAGRNGDGAGAGFGIIGAGLGAAGFGAAIGAGLAATALRGAAFLAAAFFAAGFFTLLARLVLVLRATAFLLFAALPRRAVDLRAAFFAPPFFFIAIDFLDFLVLVFFAFLDFLATAMTSSYLSVTIKPHRCADAHPNIAPSKFRQL